MTAPKSEVRVWWLFEPSDKKKTMLAYVRPATGLFKDAYPTPSSVWMRKMPPPKVMLVTDHDQEVQALKEDIEKLVKTYADGYIFDEPDDDTEQPDLMKPWRHVSGKLARQIAAKRGIKI